MNARLTAVVIVLGWAGTASAQLSPGYPQYGGGGGQFANPYLDLLA